MIHILQLLCPERHCICAIPYDAERCTEAEARAMGLESIKALQFQDHCGICGSCCLRWENGVTKFQTLAEAMPKLKQTEILNRHSRQLLDDLGISYDKRRYN